jgi:glycosyltransferase involved in cell wall biosynthesis
MHPMSLTMMGSGVEKTRAGSSGIAVVIPVYRSERILPELIRRLSEVLANISPRREIILVNDCSPDGSWEAILQLAAVHPEVKPINLMRNYGQHNALLCGIRSASYDVIITMDDDLQHPPEEIPRLLAELSRGFDVVYGVPQREEHGLLRDLASMTTKIALQRVMGAEIARRACAFRAFRREVAASFAHYEGYFVSIDVLLTWGTNRFSAIAVNHQPRAEGTSGYTFRKLVTHAMNMMTGFTTMPLQMASWVGFGFTMFSLCVLLYVALRYLVSGNPVPGFPFLASIVGLFSGAQLFALGIIGEYLARIHLRSMQKPPYVVREFGGQSQAKRAGVGSL